MVRIIHAIIIRLIRQQPKTLQMFKRRETIIFILLSIGIIILTLLQLNELFFIYDALQFLLYGVFGCTFIYCVIRAFENKREVSILERSKPSILGAILIVFFYLLSYLVETDGGKKVIFVCGFNHDLNSASYQLFKDKTFKLVNSGPFGGSINRGSYHLNNDTLGITNKNPEGKFITEKYKLTKVDNKKYFEPIDPSRYMYRLYIYRF